jgi:hypothetical protein
MPLIDPIEVHFGVDGDKELDCFVHSNIQTLKDAFDNLHNTKVPEWRRLTKGQPKDKKRDFPWPNASNTVIQLIGENVETLKAILLGSTYETLPIWVAGLVGDWPEDAQGDEQRDAYEQFMSLMALKQDELDLYRVESQAAFDISSLGMVLVKFPWITDTEAIVTGIDSLDRNKPVYEKKIIYDGPKVEKVNIQDWAATPTASTFREAEFKYHGPYKLNRQQIEERCFKGIFDKDACEKILKTPDRTGVDENTQKELEQHNIDGINPTKYTAEWDFYECWFWYWWNDVKYRIILTYHFATKTRMKAIFNFYTNNEEPFEYGRLGYNDDGLIGYGFAEMGEMYQEQVSTQHNQRNDHGTLQNTSIILTGRNHQLDSGFGIYPMACLPFSPDEFDVVNLGSQQTISNIDDEQLTIALAKARFGTDMGLPGGSGSGVSGSKGKAGPQYSAMGTFSILQTGTRRVNVNVTDFRYLHLNIGQKVGKQYANFGIGDRIKYLGSQGKLLLKALEAIKKGTLELPIKAATASINKEVEKQTGMLFTQVMQRHFTAISQAIMAVNNPILSKDMPDMRKFLIGSISAQAYVMSKLIRAFGYDDIYRMQPELDFVKSARSQTNGQQGVPAGKGNTTKTTGSSEQQPILAENTPQQGSNISGNGHAGI